MKNRKLIYGKPFISNYFLKNKSAKTTKTNEKYFNVNEINANSFMRVRGQKLNIHLKNMEAQEHLYKLPSHTFLCGHLQAEIPTPGFH